MKNKKPAGRYHTRLRRTTEQTNALPYRTERGRTRVFSVTQQPLDVMTILQQRKWLKVAQEVAVTQPHWRRIGGHWWLRARVRVSPQTFLNPGDDRSTRVTRAIARVNAHGVIAGILVAPRPVEEMTTHGLDAPDDFDDSGFDIPNIPWGP